MIAGRRSQCDPREHYQCNPLTRRCSCWRWLGLCAMVPSVPVPRYRPHPHTLCRQHARRLHRMALLSSCLVSPLGPAQPSGRHQREQLPASTCSRPSAKRRTRQATAMDEITVDDSVSTRHVDTALAPPWHGAAGHVSLSRAACWYSCAIQRCAGGRVQHGHAIGNLGPQWSMAAYRSHEGDVIFWERKSGPTPRQLSKDGPCPSGPRCP